MAIEHFSSSLDMSSFDCGNNDLNAWFHSNAAHDYETSTSHIYVYIESGRVVAFYTLTAHTIQRRVMHPNREGYPSGSNIPATLLGRLAVDKSSQNKGIGKLLIRDAIRNARISNQYVATRFLVVQAKTPQLAQWYERHGFIASPKNPLHLYYDLQKNR